MLHPMNTFIQRHAHKIALTLSCFDRLLITGSIPDIGYPQAVESLLRSKNIRLFDYPQWAEPFRDRIHENAHRIAKEHGLEIEFIRRFDSFKKEDRIQALLKTRGAHPGLVHIFSAMEACPS